MRLCLKCSPHVLQDSIALGTGELPLRTCDTKEIRDIATVVNCSADVDGKAMKMDTLTLTFDPVQDLNLIRVSSKGSRESQVW